MSISDCSLPHLIPKKQEIKKILPLHILQKPPSANLPLRQTKKCIHVLNASNAYTCIYHKYTNTYTATCPNAYPYAHTHKYMYTDVSRYYIKISFERYLKLHGRQCQFSPLRISVLKTSKRGPWRSKFKSLGTQDPILAGH